MSRRGRAKTASSEALALATGATQVPSPARCEELIRTWLDGRSSSTGRAYRFALEELARFCESESTAQAVAALLQLPASLGASLVGRFGAHLVAHGAAAATVNLRLAAISSLVGRAASQGLIGWTLSVERLPAAEPAGAPDGKAFRAMLAAAAAGGGGQPGKAARDCAILRLLHDAALRRDELVRLDLGDYDSHGGGLAVAGRRGRVHVALPAATRRALNAWVAARRELAGGEALDAAAPLFVNLSRDPRRRGGRLRGRSVARVVAAAAAAAGVRSTPHGLRRAAIAEALAASRGDVETVRRFSRHASARTLQAHERRRSAASQRPAPVAVR